MTFPMIHMNGTGKESLGRDYSDARAKLMEAQRKFETIDFNARDYYPISDGAFAKARAERGAMAAKLAEVEEYLLAHMIHICDS